MKRYKFIQYLIFTCVVLFLIYLGIFFITGKVTINVKDSSSNNYITNVNINIQPGLEGSAGPGTDGAGPFVYDIHMPKRFYIYINAKGYKDKSLNLILVPYKKYTIYLEPIS